MQQQGPTEQQQRACSQQQPVLWCQGLATGTFVAEVREAFPQVDWSPQDLVKVLWYALPAAATAVGLNTQLPAWITTALPSSINEPTLASGAVLQPLSHTLGITDSADGTPAAAVGSATSALTDAAGLAGSIQQEALLHLTQEAVLAVLLVAACRLALGPRVTRVVLQPYWAVQTLATCCILFPLVDPVLSGLWDPAVEAVLGPMPASPLVATLQEAGSTGQLGAVLLHCLASGVLGPVWEEVFWRGFFLTALTKVLPVPACIALSAFNFAALHLSPYNFLPLLVLGATCDCLYLRSGGNLLAPLLLHGLWNTSQVLQIALLHKDTFV